MISRACIRRYFDPIVLVTIVCNCITMAWESPLDPPGTTKAAFIDVCEWVYLLIFTFELMTKVVAYGFAMHEGAYLRDAWCQLDFIVVSLAWIPIIIPSFGNYSVVRSVREASRGPCLFFLATATADDCMRARLIARALMPRRCARCGRYVR